ncbi:anti-sigma factor [Sphingomonas ginsenosidivorax]|uniref:anti-sigma factor n=1 Tax=Sphingomonas ginsenosidivorax TaxID=862135 RepID=UPI001F548F43|nr:anti-sigma factor [Sphingomonas ginsenosidivorax]
MADPDVDLTAAELALGLLDGEERAAALRRLLAEPGFAAEVEWWRERFAALFDLWPEVAAGPHVAARIAATLDGTPVAARTRWPWPVLAAVSSAIAACLLLFIAIDPRPSAPVSQPVPAARPTSLLIATLTGDGDDAAGPVAAAFDAAAGSLRIAAAPAVDADKVAQLWAIGGDGVPHPLALLARTPATLRLTPADRARIVAGAVLAISVEPTGGSPTGLPTGPVIAKGVLARV